MISRNDFVLLKSLLSSRVMIATLVLLLSFDTVLLVMHIIYVYFEYHLLEAEHDLSSFNMNEDGTYSEIFEYLKNILIIFTLAGSWYRNRQLIFLTLSAIFIFTLVDNIFQLHERFGEFVSPLLQSTTQYFDTAPAALGEFLFYAAIGPALLGSLTLALFRAREEYHVYGVIFLILLILLGGFGVGVDLIHSALIDMKGLDSWTMLSGPLDKILGFVEDGGELIILSIICALSCAIYARSR